MEERLGRVKRILFFASAIAFLWLFQELLSLLQHIVITLCPKQFYSLIQVVVSLSIVYRFIVWPIIDFLISLGMLVLFYSIAQSMQTKRTQEILKSSTFDTMRMRKLMQGQGESFKDFPASLGSDDPQRFNQASLGKQSLSNV